MWPLHSLEHITPVESRASGMLSADQQTRGAGIRYLSLCSVNEIDNNRAESDDGGFVGEIK